MKTRDLSINIYDLNGKLVVSRQLEELTMELVAYSVPLDFSLEAVKCQGIIMRTNILRQIRNFNLKDSKDYLGKGVSLKDFPQWKPLKDYEKLWGQQYNKNIEVIRRAVEETQGDVITFNDKPIEARYHEACGGATENSENVDGNIILYLRRVLCRYCQESPYYESYQDISLKELEKQLGVKFPQIDATSNIEIENMIYDVIRDDTGRIVKLKIAGRELEGKELKKLLGLSSTRFSWQPQNIRFNTRGKGDAVGFCQWGANTLAKEGKRAEDIIKYYYTGVEIKKIQNNSINKPLLGNVLVIDPAHGGQEGEGYTSPNGIRERDLNLEIALYLEKILSEMGAKVILTRREDRYVPVTERANLINEVKPNFLLSLHQNFLKNSTVSGTEIYFYRGDREAELLGQLIMEKMTEKLNMTNRGVKVADFFLLREIRVSGLHIEVAYLSNPIDEEKLMQEDFKRKVAEGISEALVTYFN